MMEAAAPCLIVGEIKGGKIPVFFQMGVFPIQLGLS
jgi:hypothetical protein